MAKRALIVGINNYSILDPTGRSNLNYCVGDARSIYHLLHDDFEFNQIWYLENLKASRSKILQILNYLVRISEAGDTICFYFSGHGARLRANLSQLDCDKYYEALVPASGAWITDKDLQRITEPLYPDAVNFTVITDACHSGGLHEGDASMKCRSPLFEDNLLDTIVQFLSTLIPCGICLEDESSVQKNVSNVSNSNGHIDLDPDPNLTFLAATKSTLLSACHFNELSWETQSMGHGLFTKAMLEILPQSTSYENLVMQLQGKVREKITSLINPSRPNVSQTPQLFGQRNRMSEIFLDGWSFTPLEQ